ncbi:bifunctional hydroxymethylpyrimidine kinase/phosphomethylpyrimidine kinase [Parabacteroides sp. APC149_11_2_Y6]
MSKQTTFRYPVALTIAGSDSGGGAGIQADIKTFSALGVYGTSAITSITAQNTQGVRGIQAIIPEILEGQIHAVFEDIIVDAVKIGMLHNKEAAQVVISAIDTFKPAKIVLDPVMISTSGSKLLEDDTIDIITRELFKRVTLVTPNIDEAAFLSGMTIRNEEEMETAAYRLMEMGCNALLMKGGHLGKEEMADILYIKDQAPIRFAVPAIDTFNSHGTGCTLSSAIAAYLALGKDLQEAVRMAKQYITTALSEGANVKTGHGHGPLNHFFAPVPLIKIER